MAKGLDLFGLFPEIVAIGQPQLQLYYNEWAKRPIARQHSVAQVFVDQQLVLHFHMDVDCGIRPGVHTFIPTDQLLVYIVERHFPEPDYRRELCARIQDVRLRWGEVGYGYEVTISRKGRFYLTCKNPACHAELESAHVGTERQAVSCPPTQLTCPQCGASFIGDGSDLHLRPFN
jgi:hypothetical protein